MADAYFECSVCKKRSPFGPGDTLIRRPAVPPTGRDKIAHIGPYIGKKHIFATCTDQPCVRCNYPYVKVYIDDTTGAWYGCMRADCNHYFLAAEVAATKSAIEVPDAAPTFESERARSEPPKVE